jgi:hypothetical protein
VRARKLRAAGLRAAIYFPPGEAPLLEVLPPRKEAERSAAAAMWREIVEEWRWWAGAALGLCVLGLLERFGQEPLPALQTAGALDGLLSLLVLVAGRGTAGFAVCAALSAAGLLGTSVYLARRAKEEGAEREAARLSRALYAAGKKAWPRS